MRTQFKHAHPTVGIYGRGYRTIEEARAVWDPSPHIIGEDDYYIAELRDGRLRARHPIKKEEKANV